MNQKMAGKFTAGIFNELLKVEAHIGKSALKRARAQTKFFRDIFQRRTLQVDVRQSQSGLIDPLHHLDQRLGRRRRVDRHRLAVVADLGLLRQRKLRDIHGPDRRLRFDFDLRLPRCGFGFSDFFGNGEAAGHGAGGEDGADDGFHGDGESECAGCSWKNVYRMCQRNETGSKITSSRGTRSSVLPSRDG